MRRNDVASTSFRRRVPTRFLINQCQIITFLVLKYDIIENSRIEKRGIILPVQVGGLLGAKGYVAPPPFQIIGCPPWPHSSYAYVRLTVSFNFFCSRLLHVTGTGPRKRYRQTEKHACTLPGVAITVAMY